MTKTWIENVTIVNPDGRMRGSVCIEGGKIRAVTDQVFEPGEAEVVDGSGKLLMPGLIDPHVHFRDPGATHKEDFESGTRAALRAGVTTIFDMPNTKPAVFTLENLEAKRVIAAEKAHCHYGLFFGAGVGNIREIKQVTNIPGVKLYLNTTTGNLKMDDENQWRKVFHATRRVALHAEGDTFARAVAVWESEGFPCELHLCHASLRSEVDLVRKYKSHPLAGPKITMEVCPHHLFLTHKEREDYGAVCCMKPELATQDDIEALWEGVEDGTIDCFATDHAPHTAEEKASDVTFYGIPGVETLFPLLFTEFEKRGYDLEKFVALTSTKTVEIFHIQDKKGRVDVGYDADLILVDPMVEWKIEASQLESKSKWTPFDGFPVKGRVLQSWVSSTQEVRFSG